MADAKQEAIEELGHSLVALPHDDRAVALFHTVKAALRISTPGAVRKVVEIIEGSDETKAADAKGGHG